MSFVYLSSLYLQKLANKKFQKFLRPSPIQLALFLSLRRIYTQFLGVYVQQVWRIWAKHAYLAPFLTEKWPYFEKISMNYRQQYSDWKIQHPSSIFEDYTNNTTFNDFKYFLAKLGKIWSKNTQIVNKNNGIPSTIDKT